MLKRIALGMVLLAGLLAGTAWAADEALFDAVRAGDKAKIEALISKGADVNAKDKYSWTPLHRAAQYDKKDVAEYLISKGAYVNARDEDGATPLHEAARYGKKDVAEYLISKGAYVNARNKISETPLHKAASNDKKDVAEYLISKGADVNARNIGSETPLYKAASFGKKDVAEYLISKGADVNAKDFTGDTPLHLAAYYGNKEVAEIFIAKGADVNAKNEYGATPLHKVAYYGKKEVAEYLISKGADVNAKDNDGKTPLDSAISNGKIEVVSLLQSELQKQKEMPAFLQAALQLQKPGNQREAFNQVAANYKGRAMSDTIRRPFIALAAKLKPAPAIPEEARKYLIRGNALLGDAKNPGEARAAIQEYQNALLAAPWWDDAYYNLSKAQELAGDLDGAFSSMQYYLLTEPQDKREAQDRLYAIEAKRDKARGK